MDRKEHWENTYAGRRSRKLSWYQKNPERSLAMIHNAVIGLDSPIIDVGGGASVLIDCLLNEGYRDLTVLDISSTALGKSRRRLEASASRVEWIEQDITRFVTDRLYALWHDRAVFHFLTRKSDRKLYVQALRKALQPGGQALIAAFAIGGPKKCSGLDIVQYDATGLSNELGREFLLLEEEQENHLTPDGRLQRFGYYRFIRK